MPTIFKLPQRLRKPRKTRKPPAVRSVVSTDVNNSQTVADISVSGQSAATTSALPSTSSAELHQYSLPSPRKLKRHLDVTAQALENTQKRLKTAQQRTRRLVAKVKSLKDVIEDLQNRQLLSQQAAENLSTSFSGPALDLVMHCITKGSGEATQQYPDELRAFALTLQFYSSRAAS